MPLPRQKEFSCFDCKFYRPDETREFQGNCCRFAPTVESGTGPGEPGMEWAFLEIPGEMWCGDFEKWIGPERAKGTCPPAVRVAAAADVTDPAADKLAADTAAKAAAKKGK